MLDADAVINNSSQKVGESGPRKTHRIYARDCVGMAAVFRLSGRMAM